uniref:Uncharacterized protein n=1 Tax=Glycine max TaxID=3847 RepID=A0A0R0J498_SOYBN
MKKKQVQTSQFKRNQFTYKPKKKKRRTRLSIYKVEKDTIKRIRWRKDIHTVCRVSYFKTGKVINEIISKVVEENNENKDRTSNGVSHHECNMFHYKFIMINIE